MGIASLFFGKSYKAIGGYFGLLDSAEIKIKKLISSELDSAIMALKQAQNSETETVSLLREARNKFNKAIYLEKEERLVAAYLGLVLCHYQLGDINNAVLTLKEFAALEINFGLQRKLEHQIKGECGYLLSSTSSAVEKVFKNTAFQQLSPNLLKSFGNRYLNQLSDRANQLSEDNYYRMYRLSSKIEQLQEASAILADNLPAIATNQISQNELEKPLTRAFFNDEILSKS